jgi:hypothetical protein
MAAAVVALVKRLAALGALGAAAQVMVQAERLAHRIPAAAVVVVTSQAMAVAVVQEL